MSDYQHYVELRHKIADLENISAVLSWDQEVNMPTGGAAFRAQQAATLSGLIFEYHTAPEYQQVVEKLKGDSSLTFVQKRNIEESFRFLERNRKMSKEFVQRESMAISEAYQAWMKSREDNKFGTFAPALEKIVNIQKEKAELLGYKEHPYDALLDLYEPGLTTARVSEIFVDVKAKLKQFLSEIKDQPQPDDSFLHKEFDQDKQMEVCKKIAGDLGYDWNNGRLDLSPHPFSISFNPKDARITTRLNTHDLRESIWGVIHETGHAFYEMGLPESEYGLPSGMAVSLSIHESQSRLWENNVGKSRAFIDAWLPYLKSAFPEQLNNVDEKRFHRGLNLVRPDLIRTNSDEVTYHFHVLLRFEIERGLMDRSIAVKDLEEIWNAKIKEYLGLDVPSAKQGVLQDIHWSHGSIGYFPTYSLGSFYAAQFFHFAQQSGAGTEEQIRTKNYAPLLGWLRENIHSQGQLYYSDDLCKKVTGEPLNYTYFDKYLRNKYGQVYDIPL